MSEAKRSDVPLLLQRPVLTNSELEGRWARSKKENGAMQPIKQAENGQSWRYI